MLSHPIVPSVSKHRVLDHRDLGLHSWSVFCLPCLVFGHLPSMSMVQMYWVGGLWTVDRSPADRAVRPGTCPGTCPVASVPSGIPDRRLVGRDRLVCA